MLILIETTGCADQNLLMYMTSVIPPQNFSLLTLKLAIGLPLPENPHVCSYEVVMKEPVSTVIPPYVLFSYMHDTVFFLRQHPIMVPIGVKTPS